MRVVADETARASYDMLENLVQRASRLSLASRPGSTKVAKQGSSRRDSSVVTSAGRNRSSSSEGYSDTSGALRSNDDLGSLGYSFEHSDLGAQPELPHSEPTPGCSQTDPQSPQSSFNVDSPGLQTLASLKREAVIDLQKRGKITKNRSKGQPGKSSTTRRRTSRTCKFMKEVTTAAWNEPGPLFWAQWTQKGVGTIFFVKFVKRTFPFTRREPVRASDITRPRST